MKNRQSKNVIALVTAVLFSLFALSTPEGESSAKETVEDVQLDDLVATAKTKADQLKISSMYAAEAKAEAAKAQQLRDQSEAYKVHKQDFYSRNILDLIEHTDALARNYQEASDRHKYLATIHEQIAAEMKR